MENNNIIIGNTKVGKQLNYSRFQKLISLRNNMEININFLSNEKDLIINPSPEIQKYLEGLNPLEKNKLYILTYFDILLNKTNIRTKGQDNNNSEIDNLLEEICDTKSELETQPITIINDLINNPIQFNLFVKTAVKLSSQVYDLKDLDNDNYENPIITNYIKQRENKIINTTLGEKLSYDKFLYTFLTQPGSNLNEGAINATIEINNLPMLQEENIEKKKDINADERLQLCILASCNLYLDENVFTLSSQEDNNLNTRIHKLLDEKYKAKFGDSNINDVKQNKESLINSLCNDLEGWQKFVYKVKALLSFLKIFGDPEEYKEKQVKKNFTSFVDKVKTGANISTEIS
jgi:hypothetical protein